MKNENILQALMAGFFILAVLSVADWIPVTLIQTVGFLITAIIAVIIYRLIRERF